MVEYKAMLEQFIAHAQDLPGGTNTGSSGSGVILNPLNVSSIQDFIAKILEVVVQVGLPVLVVSFVYVGYLFVQARGNPEGLKTAKGALVSTVIGAAIVLGAFIISTAISTTINNLK